MTAEARNTQLREAIECCQGAAFRDRKCGITPRLVETVFGDGQQLIGFTLSIYRPGYYVVRVDSRWKISNWEATGPYVGEHTEEIWGAIQRQFGRAWYQDGPRPRKYERPWPAQQDAWGCKWFSLTWPAGFEPPTTAIQADVVLADSPAP